MNAQAKPADDVVDAEYPTLANAPMRPNPNAIEIDGRMVIVSHDWFVANDAQLRHITAACIEATRAGREADQAVLLMRRERDDAATELATANACIKDLTEQARTVDQSFAEVLPLYQAAVIVSKTDGGTGIDWPASMIESFAKITTTWKGAMTVLGDLCDLKKVKDALGETTEYRERQPKAWEAAIAVVAGGLPPTLESAISLMARLQQSEADRLALKDEVERLTREINTPETGNFLAGVMREAAHQRERWGTDHDGTKNPEDWTWLIGHLVGKALRNFAMAAYARDAAKRYDPPSATLIAEAEAFQVKGVHHIITSAAALANWHLNATAVDTRMGAGRVFQAEDEPEHF